MKLRGILQLIVLLQVVVSAATLSDCRVECNEVHDIAIIWDRSANSTVNFVTGFGALVEFITRFNPGPTVDRIALVTFDDTARVIFPLDNFGGIYYTTYLIFTTDLFSQRVGGSNFSAALDLTKMDIFPASVPSPQSTGLDGDRQYTPNICFFLAGGPQSLPNPSLSISATALKDICNVVAVGIGPTVIPSEIMTIASNGQGILLNDMQEFRENINDLIKDACPGNTTLYKCRNGSVIPPGGNGDWELFMSSVAPGNQLNNALHNPNLSIPVEALFAPGNGPHIFRLTFNPSCRRFLHRISIGLLTHVPNQNVTATTELPGGQVGSWSIIFNGSNNYVWETIGLYTHYEYFEFSFPATCTQSPCSGVYNISADYTICCKNDCSEICCHHGGLAGQSQDGCCECSCPGNYSGDFCEIFNGTTDYSDCCCVYGGEANIDENGCCYCENCTACIGQCPEISRRQGRFCELKPETKFVTKVDHPLLHTLQSGPIDPTTYTRPDNCDWTYTHSSYDHNHPVAEALSSQNGCENSTDFGNATYGGFAPNATNATACLTFNDPVMLHEFAGQMLNPSSNLNFVVMTIYNGYDIIFTQPVTLTGEGYGYGNLTFGYPGIQVTKVQFSTLQQCNGSCFGLDHFNAIYTKLTKTKLPQSPEFCCQRGPKVLLDTGCLGCKCVPPYTGQYCEAGGLPFCQCHNGGTPYDINGCCRCHCPSPTPKKHYVGRYCQTKVKLKSINNAGYKDGKNPEWTLMASSSQLKISRALRPVSNVFYFKNGDVKPRLWLYLFTNEGFHVNNLKFMLSTKQTAPQTVTLLFKYGFEETWQTTMTIMTANVLESFTVTPPFGQKFTSIKFVFPSPCTVKKCFGVDDMRGKYLFQISTEVNCTAVAHEEDPPCCKPGNLFFDWETQECKCKPKVTFEDIQRLG